MQAPYPLAHKDLINPQAETAMQIVIESIRAIRNAKAELSVPPSQMIDAVIVATHENATLISQNQIALETLAKARPSFAPEAPVGSEVVALPIASGLDIYLPLAGLIDIEKEKTRVASDLAKIASDLEKTQAKLTNSEFVARAAPEVVAKFRAQEIELLTKRDKLTERQRALNGA